MQIEKTWGVFRNGQENYYYHLARGNCMKLEKITDAIYLFYLKGSSIILLYFNLSNFRVPNATHTERERIKIKNKNKKK